MAATSNYLTKRNLLKMIRSKYIFKQITDNLHKIRLLEIVRYNKNLKGKCNFNINDYINEYSKIEIELIPEENKYGKFINIFNKKNEDYYHIFFNDDKKETKTNKISSFKKTDKIKIIIDNKIKSLYRLFINCNCIKKLILLNLIEMI